MILPYRESLSCSPSRTPDNYVYSILPAEGEKLVALTSVDELVLLDKKTLKVVNRNHDQVPRSVSCMTDCANAENLVICAGREGDVATIDLRSMARVSHFKTDGPVSSLAHHGFDIAVGSETVNSQATISVWDARQCRMRWHNSENNDDITASQFDPSSPTTLLSGGDDGVVGIWDTNVSDENDSLVQAVQLAPIHKVGFLQDSFFYSLSSDQKLSIHVREDRQDDTPPFMAGKDFGDVRPLVNCDYVIGLHQLSAKPHVVAGSNFSQPHIDVIPLESLSELSSLSPNFIRLEGAHGEEIVRSVHIDQESPGAIFTAGEDGLVKCFNAGITTDQDSSIRDPAENQSKEKPGRFKPY